MALVVGTAGHIDHGKTTLLRALTGIDADRLPEERRRGMTIDVGYAHLTLPDGVVIDFVDVPGHDRLVGNMLVGAGEIDAALLVVAADDGPRAQTLEHLALLDALAIDRGLVVITKVDRVEPDRVEAVANDVAALLEPTSLRGARVVPASAVTGAGLAAVTAELAALPAPDRTVPSRPPTMAVDRAFSVRGRGVVVTGTLRGGPLTNGDRLRVVPGVGGSGGEARIRGIQVHGGPVDTVADGGRTALNLAGVGLDDVPRGTVLTADPEVQATDRVLATFRRTPADRTAGRLHTATAGAGARVGRTGRDALVLTDGTSAGVVRLDAPLALRSGDRFVLRRSPGQPPIGGVVLDAAPARGLSRRRQDAVRVAALAGGAPGARLELHGALAAAGGGVELAHDVRRAAGEAALDAVGSGAPVRAVRAAADARLRRLVTIRREDAAAAAREVVEDLVAAGTLVRDTGGEQLRPAGAPAPSIAPDPATTAAKDRLVAALATPTPPRLAAAAGATGCSPQAIRELERDGVIVVLEPDHAYAASTYRELTTTALTLAAEGPLTPARLRDATGTSRKYVMALLEDLDRRGVLRRTPAGHVRGPRAGSA